MEIENSNNNKFAITTHLQLSVVHCFTMQNNNSSLVFFFFYVSLLSLIGIQYIFAIRYTLQSI